MKRTITYIRKSLNDYYPQPETEALINLIFNKIYNCSKQDRIVNADAKFSEEEFDQVKPIVRRLQNFEPIQHILEEADFYGLTFKVSPDVLVPRNETEELVDLILKEHSGEELKVLDIGTGSGCIPITIKKNSPVSKVFACDISEKALAMASENAGENLVSIEFFSFDALSDNPLPFTPFDIIVSNPPYVTEREKKQMEPNVLNYDPHLALFVPDEDPLLFYRSIAKIAEEHLKTSGKLYFEINEAYGKEVVELLETHNFEAQLIKDINGKDRIVSAQKNKP